MGVATRHQHQRPVDRHNLIQEYSDVHRPRLGHAVVARPGAVILVPLPDIARKGGFGVDLVLMHVDLLTEQLLDWADHAGVARQQPMRLVIQMRREGRTRRPGLLSPDLGTDLAINRICLRFQNGDFFRRKGFRQEHVALAVELLYLVFRQHFSVLPHAAFGCNSSASANSAWRMHWPGSNVPPEMAASICSYMRSIRLSVGGIACSIEFGIPTFEPHSVRRRFGSVKSAGWQTGSRRAILGSPNPPRLQRGTMPRRLTTFSVASSAMRFVESMRNGWFMGS